MPSASSYLLHVYVSQKPNIKRSPNGIKTDGELFWNIYDFWEVKSTRDGDGGGDEAGGARPGASWAPRKAVDAVVLGQER